LPVVTNLVEAVYVSVASALSALLSFIPALIGALIILLIGWVLAGILARLVRGLLERIGFERAAERTGVTAFLGRTGWRQPSASHLLGELVKWFIRLIFLEAAATAIHLTAVTDIINRLVLFIPNLIVALLVLMVGALVARLVAGLVRGAAGEAGFANANLLGTLAQVTILGFAVIVAVNQIGIATSIVNTLFTALVGALALAFGLAFGLGGRDIAARIWAQWYQMGQEMGPRLQAPRHSAPPARSESAAEQGSGPGSFEGTTS
jgi:Conserved TM helix